MPLRHLSALSAALLGLASALAADLDRPITLKDGGSDRVFEIACDELHCHPTTGVSHALAIDEQKNGSTIAKTAANMAAALPASFDLVVYEKGKPRTTASRRSLSRRILVTMDGSAGAADIAHAVGAKGFEVPPYSLNHLILSFAAAGDSLSKLKTVRAAAGVVGANPLLGKQNVKKLTPNDARYAWSPSNSSYQWHLNNTGENDSIVGLDANITGVWDTYLGEDVTISIVDDGLEVGHPDLAANVNTAIDHDWNDATPDDPTPSSSVDDHGTACAGVAAARGDNTIGVSGAAPRAKLVGLRLIAANTTDAEDAAAINWRTDVIDVSSNSWGQADNGRDFYTMGPLLTAALADGVSTGRGGKGTIYVWAAGNGREEGDYSNYDGYNNAIETISVGAVNYKGKQSWYSESGANLLISAPSDADNGQPAITTTTLVAKGTYTNGFGGTSSATPLVSGVIALMLEANPALGWRDVQEILIRSAERIDAASAGWTNNGAGFHFHHGYGSGMIDAAAAVAMAETWQNLGTQQIKTEASGAINLPIPDDTLPGVASTLTFSGSDLRVEHVQLTVDIDHTYRGDVVITLTSPDGTVSQFTEGHDDGEADISNYTFLSVRHWGEMANGTWTVSFGDAVSEDTGTVRSLSLKAFGTQTLTGYDAWAATNITSGQDGSPTADPDHDGRSNLYEYAINGNPAIADTTGDPQLIEATNSARMRFVTDTTKTDVTHAVYVSDDLETWNLVTTSVVSTNGSLVTREAVLPGGPDRQFARLEFTR